MNRLFVTASMGLSLVGCQLSGSIDGAVDRDTGPCMRSTGVCRSFEIYSLTPNAFVVSDPAYRLGAVAYCDGRAYSTSAGTLAISCSPVLGNCGGQQVNIEIPIGTSGWPPGRACYFQLQQSRVVPITTGGYTNPEPTYSNRFGPVGKVRILSATNNGVAASTQRFTLVGDFPGFTVASAYSPLVVCDDNVVTTTVEQFSPTQVRLAFAASPAARDCVLRVVRNSDNVHSTGYHERLGALPAQLPAGFAGYVWSGHTSPQVTPQLQHGVASVVAAGMRSARLRLAPGMRLAELAGNAGGFYENPGLDARAVLAACPINRRFLGCAVALPEYQQAINALPTGSPNNRVYVPMTVYDSATTGPFFLDAGHLLDASFLNAHDSEIVAEYHELTYKLFETQIGTGRTFIIANWESESQFTSGTAAALKLWLKLRQQGIQNGRAAARAAGLTADSPLPALNPARVADGIEFTRFRTGPVSALHHFIAGTIDSTDTLGPLCPEYALWSAWEGSNAGTLDEDIPAIRALLQQKCPATTLIVGELASGYPQDPNARLTPRELWHLLETARAAFRWNLPTTVLWEGYSTQVPGLLNPDGSDKAEMRSLRTDLTAYAAIAVRPPQAIQINGIADRGITSPGSSQRNFELYGSFPGAPSSYVAQYRCDGIGQMNAVVTLPPTNGQMNIRITNPAPPPGGPKERFCTFWVVSGTTRSPEVGPRGLCPVTGPAPNGTTAPHTPC